MTEWLALELLKENLVTYFTGSTLILAIAIWVFAIIIFLAIGMDFRYALTLTIPLIGAFLIGGWLVTSTGVAVSWIVNAAIIVVALFIAWVFIRLMT